MREMKLQFRQRVTEKITAATVHALASLVLAALAGWVVFYLWFPRGMADLAKGTEIYWLVLVVDIALGPIISLVIYDSRKSMRELMRDYSFVLGVQVAALFYGLYAVAQSRPVYIIFVKDSFELVTSVQLSNKDIADAEYDEYRVLPWLGPRLVCTESPADPGEKSILLFSAVDGKDIQLFPKYYRPCVDGEITDAAYDKGLLSKIIKDKKLNISLPKDDFSWLPVKTRFETWVEVYPRGEYTKRFFLAVDPYPE